MGTIVNLVGVNAKPFQSTVTKRINLQGSRNTKIDGYGSNIHQSGSGDTIVHGDVQSVSQTGSGDLKVNGNVAGDVQQTGSGDINITGSVQGNVSQMGSGDLYVKGDVYGNVSQMGSGRIKVYGSVQGKVSKFGSGDIYVRIYGSEKRKNNHIVIASVPKRGFGLTRVFDYRDICQLLHGKFITDSARSVKRTTQICAKNVLDNTRKYFLSGLNSLKNNSSVQISLAKLFKAPNLRFNLGSASIRNTSGINKSNKLSLSAKENELECPICLEITDKEIYQCKNGHMICSSCSSKVNECPQCRVNLKVDGALIRNRLAESLVAKMHRCGFAEKGCTFKGNREQIEAHTKDCECKYGSVNIKFD